jgi:hypothetical protein
MTHQNFDKCRRKDFIEGRVSGEENEETDREGDEEEDVGDEEVGERLRYVFKHLDVLAESRNLADEKHLERKQITLSKKILY